MRGITIRERTSRRRACSHNATPSSTKRKRRADTLRKKRELDDAKRELDLTVKRRVQASLAEERHRAKNEADDDRRFKVAEREQQIAFDAAPDR